MTRTYWLSFCDTNQPDGERFTGASVVDVTDRDMLRAIPELLSHRPEGARPIAVGDEAAWIAAAILVAHRAGCNPGGTVGVLRLDDLPAFPLRGDRYPRQTLLSEHDIHLIDSSAERA